MAIVRPYHKYRGVDSFSLEDFVSVAAGLVRAVVPRQTRYRVAEIPTARSVRFYTARGLVDKPLATAGGRSRYGYRHLLQLLVLKYLQAQYLPLVKIRSLMEGVGNRDLEQLLPHGGGGGQLALLRERPREAGEPAGGPNGAGQRGAAPPPPEPVAADGGGDGDAWHRLEVSPGIELHVHAEALSGGQRQALRAALLREMGRLRGWTAGP